jgi:DNA (cytosine-5)-methyltransferase 1
MPTSSSDLRLEWLLAEMRKAVSLFAGAGGFCEGVRLAGFQVVCAVENDAAACKTHAANFPKVALFEGDIHRFLRDEKEGVPGRKELLKDGVDLVYGGPPCQGFSQIGPRKLNDPRNGLYKQFVRVVRTLQPSMFVMENVPNMLAMKKGHFRSKILGAFQRAGYKRIAVVPLTASEFGVPQHRRRVFVFGLRDGIECKEKLLEAISKLTAKQKHAAEITVAQAISDLPFRISAEDKPLPYPSKRKQRFSDFQRLMRLDCSTQLLSSVRKRRGHKADLLHNHHTKGMEERRKKIVKVIPAGGTGDILPPKMWNGVRGHKWRRLDPKQPSYTILAQMHRDLSEWIHPKHNRWITVREAARLQSFHDGFIFHGSECQQLKQVGNAVPPLMALAVARASKRLLESISSKSRRRG